MKLFDVIGLGVATVDLVQVVDELPGEELVQRAHETVLQGGGPVATALVTLARLGSRTAMLDSLGDDWRGGLIIDEFQREGVCTDYLTVCARRTSSIASILVRRRDGARTIIFSPGDAGELVLSDQQQNLIPAARILHFNGRHLQACLAAARIARAHGVMVSFDGGAHRYREEVRELVGFADVCIVARQFALAFSGADNIETAARAILEAGPDIVVITAGIEGSWIFSREGEAFHQPAFAVERVVDTTGAGDAYHGAFLHGLAHDFSLSDCAALASAVAAINTTSLGGRTALPSSAEAERFMSAREGGATTGVVG